MQTKANNYSQNFVYPSDRFDFIRVPKMLLQDNIVSPDAALLFAYFMDRHNLSRSNGSSWRTEEGQVFVIFTIENICRLMKCKHDKASKLLNELEDARLIRKCRQGVGLPSRIFVIAFCDSDNSDPSPPKNSSQACGKTAAINNRNINKTDINHSSLTKSFAMLWEAYPRHRRGNRRHAMDEFHSAIQSEEDAHLAWTNLQLWKDSEQWTTDDGKYVHAMHNWFALGLWKSTPRRTSTIYGCSELGDDELEAIRCILADNADQKQA